MADGDNDMERRSFLKTAGAAAAAATTAASAGCLSGGGEDTGTETGTGTGDGGDLSGNLIYARGDHPEKYDPQQTTSGEVAKVTNQLYDQLLRFEPGTGGQLGKGLAKDWTLSGKTATLTLKEGVKFHNGEEFTASDVKATVRRFTDSDYDHYLGDKARSAYGPITFGNWIDSMDASADYELEITLTQKYAPFLRNLAMFAAAIFNKKNIESVSDQANYGTKANPAVGTGPFEWGQLDNGSQRVQLDANTNYWGDGPNVESVIFKTVTSNTTRAQEIIGGDSHITDNLGAQGSKKIENSGSATLLSKNGINIGYMAFNMARKEAFQNKKVRQAISYAVNTEAIVNDIYEGFATQADQPLPPDVLGYNESLDPYPTDKDKAQTMLEEAGASDLEFELATFSNPRGYNPNPSATANQVKSDLEEIGLTVNIEKKSSFSSYIKYTSAGKHDACFLGWYTDNADPDNFMASLLDPGVSMDQIPDGQDWVGFDSDGFNTLNVAAWANPDFLQKIRDGAKTYDEAERKTLYKEASKMAHDEAPWVYIDYAQTLRAIADAVDESSYTVSSVGGPYLESVQIE